MTAYTKICTGIVAWLLAGTVAMADIPGDGDGDGDIDFTDVVFLADCQSGPDTAAITLCRNPFDFDFDLDIDMHDFAAQQRCFGGENQPVGPNCADHTAYIEGDCLFVIGTIADSTLSLRLKAGEPTTLQVDVANDGWAEFEFDRTLFNCIVIDARAGHDTVIISDQNGAFTGEETTTIIGGAGQDTLIGGSGGEIFIGGDGNDTIQAGDGSDLIIWNHGDDADVVDGQGGFDTIEVNGSNLDEDFTITANGTRVRFDRLTPAPFFIDIGTCEQLVLNAGGGDDSLACTGNLAALIKITADGGPGADTLLGSNGADVLVGGDGDDFVDPQQGSDTVFMGAGNDTFQWDPGDGSDTVEGEDGHDVVLFNGSAGNEIFDFAANGSRLRFMRNLGSIVLDANGVEQFDLRALGGADIVNVNEMTGVEVSEVNIDLAASLAGNSGDALADSVNIIGTPAADSFYLSAADGYTVVELSPAIRVKGHEALDQVVFTGAGGDVIHVKGTEGPDQITVISNGSLARVDAPGYSAAVGLSGALSLTVQALGGDDFVSCTGNLAAIVPITIEGGPGQDTLLGSNGHDVLIGGEDNDFLDGQQGNDYIFGGEGDDSIQWDPGDGSDIVEGEAGHDVMLFNGSAGSEIFDLSANGSRLRFTRNLGSIVLDAAGMEQFELRALAGADAIVVHELTGLELTAVNIDLAGAFGGSVGDGVSDSLVVEGTSLADTIHVAVDSNALEISGLAAIVRIEHSELANDSLAVNGLEGADAITFDPDVTSFIQLSVNE